ncbi:MAG: sugar transferase [Gemmatimonadota bacterium]|nr:sugar transferase [Gemmatimonadota bacterium]
MGSKRPAPDERSPLRRHRGVSPPTGRAIRLHESERSSSRPDRAGAEDVEVSVSPVKEFVLRAINVSVAFTALVVLSPVLAAIAVAIKLDSPGPVLYRQLRVGLDRRDTGMDRSGGRRTADLGGRPFLIYKFRTMHVDAENESGPVWARPDDERTTRVGRFLRRYRLDELPQLWNVLKGDMSVVGPRPERPAHVLQLREAIRDYGLRQQVRPGITGWAQINLSPDRTVDDVRRKVGFDLEYIRERTVARELRIMMQTPFVMLGRPYGDRRGGRGETRDEPAAPGGSESG